MWVREVEIGGIAAGDAGGGVTFELYVLINGRCLPAIGFRRGQCKYNDQHDIH